MTPRIAKLPFGRKPLGRIQIVLWSGEIPEPDKCEAVHITMEPVGFAPDVHFIDDRDEARKVVEAILDAIPD